MCFAKNLTFYFGSKKNKIYVKKNSVTDLLNLKIDSILVIYGERLWRNNNNNNNLLIRLNN